MTAAEFVTWRKHLDLTQTGAAQLLGVDIRTVQRWEAGDSSVSQMAQNLMGRIQIDTLPS